MFRALLTAAIVSLAAPAFAEEPTKVAFFGMTLIDTGPGARDAADERRLSAIQARLVEAMTETGRYAFVDTGPVAGKADLYANLAHCNGCDARLAAEVGADIALTGEVQKTSNLILSLSIFIRDAETGELIGGGSADMRGNTDETWMRAVNYVLKNRILR